MKQEAVYAEQVQTQRKKHRARSHSELIYGDQKESRTLHVAIALKVFEEPLETPLLWSREDVSILVRSPEITWKNSTKIIPDSRGRFCFSECFQDTSGPLQVLE